jgi:hypothetical protein
LFSQGLNFDSYLKTENIKKTDSSKNFKELLNQSQAVGGSNIVGGNSSNNNLLNNSYLTTKNSKNLAINKQSKLLKNIENFSY